LLLNGASFPFASSTSGLPWCPSSVSALRTLPTRAPSLCWR